MKKLNGKTALITGANSGIGYATAELFIQEGAQVIITGRRSDAVKEAAQKLGHGTLGIVSDSASMSDVKKLPEEIKKHVSSIDILYANAGVANFAPFHETTEALFDNTLDINFKSVFFTVQGLLPIIHAGGSVILNSTILVHSGLESSAAYSASKGAILTLNKTLAIELASRDIRVNSVSPGPINTPIYSKMGMPEEVLKAFAAGVQAKIPLRKFGEAKEVAHAVLFLASSDSSFITGSELVVDGGKSMAF